MAQRTNIPPVVCVGPQYCGTTLNATTLNNDIKNADAALSTAHLKALCLPSTAGGVMQPFLGYGYNWQVPQQGYDTAGGFNARQNEYRPFAHFSGVCPNAGTNDPTLWVYEMYRDIPVIAHSWEDSFALTVEGMRGQREPLSTATLIANGGTNSLEIFELQRINNPPTPYFFYYKQFFRIEYYMGGILSPLVLLDESDNDTDFPINTLRSNYNLNAYDFRGAMPLGYAPPVAGQDRTDFVRVIVKYQRGGGPLAPPLSDIYFVFARGNAGAFGETDFDGISSVSFSMYKSPC